MRPIGRILPSAATQIDPVVDPDGYTADRVAYTAWVEARGTTLYTRGTHLSPLSGFSR